MYGKNEFQPISSKSFAKFTQNLVLQILEIRNKNSKRNCRKDLLNADVLFRRSVPSVLQLPCGRDGSDTLTLRVS